jgi:hypothetical protein
MRVRFRHHIAPLLLSFLLALPPLLPRASCAVQASVTDQIPDQAPAAQTLAIFTDRHIPDDLWPALVDALHEELDSGSLETRVLLGEMTGHATGPATDQASGKDISRQVQIVRGDTIGPDGLIGERSITVYLHGDCKIIPRPRPVYPHNAVPEVSGPLGWVLSNRGHIGPFANVECDHLAEMLAIQAFGLNREGRNRLMAVAIARVILHEWIHIATQNPHHSGRGLTKAYFGVGDLLVHPAKATVPPDTRLPDKHDDSRPSF